MDQPRSRAGDLDPWVAETIMLIRETVEKATPDELQDLSEALSATVYGMPFGSAKHRAAVEKVAVEKRAALIRFFTAKLDKS